MKPFFSVVIPTLNEVHYLPHLLKDLSHQTFTNFETLVADAHSDDHTLTHARKFTSHLSLKLLTSRIANPGHQRNLGASKARGKYLVFFDADVRILPHHLEKIRTTIHHHPEALFLTSWTKSLSRQKFDQLISLASNLGLHLASLTPRPAVDGNNIIIERQLFTSISGFNTDLKAFEDFDLAERLLREGVKLHIYRSPHVYQTYRRFYHEDKFQLLKKVFTAYHQYYAGKKFTTPIYDYHHPPTHFNR